MRIWYGVRDLDEAAAFYTEKLAFREVYRSDEGRWMRLAGNGVEIGLAEGATLGETQAVATIEVADVKAEADRLRAAGVEVGVVLEIPHTLRLVDVFDPDGNRVQLTQDL